MASVLDSDRMSAKLLLQSEVGLRRFLRTSSMHQTTMMGGSFSLGSANAALHINLVNFKQA